MKKARKKASVHKTRKRYCKRCGEAHGTGGEHCYYCGQHLSDVYAYFDNDLMPRCFEHHQEFLQQCEECGGKGDCPNCDYVRT
jgi:hypothetical protein